MMIRVPKCFRCVHYLSEEEKAKCLAFPKGIPEEIWMGRHDHAKPYPGDSGILFTAEDAPGNNTFDFDELFPEED